MQLHISEENSSVHVKIFGELDLKVADELRDSLDEIIENMNNKNLVLDFYGVDFIDSSGLGVILGRYKKLCKKNSKLIILHPKANVKRIFDISGIMSIIEVKS